MRFPFEQRRNLINFDTSRLPSVETDVLVIGSGVAGLTAAIKAAESSRKVFVISKDSVKESNTENAQGGIAVVMQDSDSFESHIRDTLDSGAGLSDEKTVEVVVKEGPERVKDLIRLGARFDRQDGEFSFAREGGHSLARIVHASGDETGREIVRVLLKRARRLPNITMREGVFAIDLIVRDKTCLGLLAYDRTKRLHLVIWSPATILATGGAGQLYRETTNPSVATADGVAIAYRAGAQIRDIEFVQFHPTTLYVAGAARFLISETVRGEGGILRDRNGVHFMPNYHPLADLAPRDVVSRSIIRHMQQSGDTNVYLDLTHMSPERIKVRFPALWELCERFQIECSRNFIPVRPSAHYMIGGVRTDLRARTNIEGLFAAGEVASTGLHGANRLGSNSLLEGLVFGHRAALAAGDLLREKSKSLRRHRIRVAGEHPKGGRIDFTDVINSLKALMWRNVGIERSRDGLEEALRRLSFWASYLMDKEFGSPEGWVLQNMLTVASLMAGAALRRTESRGAHIRLDYPDRDDEKWRRHIIIKRASPFTTSKV